VLYAVPFLLVSYFLYIGAISPATDWGLTVRSSIDLHRLDLYEKLGVRAPTSFSDERELAMNVNKALLFGHPLLKDDLWRAREPESEKNRRS
jgi:alpha-D-ribose 1-methylphosphonate 5-triphosphate synthase subunit PhnL